jgi:hypothetical protein
MVNPRGAAFEQTLYLFLDVLEAFESQKYEYRQLIDLTLKNREDTFRR